MSLEGVSREGLVNVLRARTRTHVGVQCTRQEWSDRRRQASLLTGGLAVRSVVCHLMFIQQYKGSPTFLKTRRKRTISQVTAGLLGPDPVFVHLVPLYIKDRTASITKDFLSPLPRPFFEREIDRARSIDRRRSGRARRCSGGTAPRASAASCSRWRRGRRRRTVRARKVVRAEGRMEGWIDG